MVLQRRSQQAFGTCCHGFLLPKPKPITKTEADSDQWEWFHIQRRLLSTTRPEKLWRYYKDLRLNKWDECGLCIQLEKGAEQKGWDTGGS